MNQVVLKTAAFKNELDPLLPHLKGVVHLLNSLILLLAVCQNVHIHGEVVARSSKPFEPYRLECPRKFAAARLTLHKVRGPGGLRDDTMIVGLCHNFTQQYPSLRDTAGNDHDESCHWTESRPIPGSVTFSQVCSSEKEYIAGISRRDVSMYGFLCCQLIDRKRRKCFAKRYNFPLTDDEPEITIDRKEALITSFAYQNEALLVQFCVFDVMDRDEMQTEFGAKHAQFTLQGTSAHTQKPILIGESQERRLKVAALENPQVAKLVLLRETDESNHAMSLQQRGWRQFKTGSVQQSKTQPDKQLQLRTEKADVTQKPKPVLAKVRIVRLNTENRPLGNVSYELPDDVSAILSQVNLGKSRSKEDTDEKSQEEESDATADNPSSLTTLAAGSSATKKVRIVIVRKRNKSQTTATAASGEGDQQAGNGDASGLVRLAQERGKKKVIVKKITVFPSSPAKQATTLAVSKSASTSSQVKPTAKPVGVNRSSKAPGNNCSVDKAATDKASGLVIACGQLGTVWKPQRCPQPTICSTTSDTSFMICC